MTKEQKIKSFQPNAIALANNAFIGLPFSEADAKVVLFPVPWDVTVSSCDGTASGAANILKASYQLDLYDEDVPDAWKMGLYMRTTNKEWSSRNKKLRAKAMTYIDWLEEGSPSEVRVYMEELRDQVNVACGELKDWVASETEALLKGGKLVGLIGGDHSTPLGYLETLSKRYTDFGILQIDAHMDLRKAYEEFTYSHASIFYNALKMPSITSLVQVGIRDFCEEEFDLSKKDPRVSVFFEKDIRSHLYEGGTFAAFCEKVIEKLPQQVYISLDVDGLDPKLCPNTGTPVPGGFDMQEIFYLLRQLVKSGRTIIGFDLSEVAGVGNNWDGNVGARLAYKLANLMGGIEK